MSELERETRSAYGEAASVWAAGPDRVYGPLAAAVVAHSPVDLDGALLLDVGAGTGAVGDHATARGARCVEVDVAVAMLRHDRTRARRGVAADGRRLPFRDGTFDVVASNCSLSHVEDPRRMLVDAARVTRRGGAVVCSTFPNTTSSHPAWATVEDVLRECGYERPRWYEQLKVASEPQVGTAGSLAGLATAAGLRATDVAQVTVETGVSAPDALVDWRLGMAQHAGFLARLEPGRRRAVRAAAVERVGTDPQPLRVDLLLLVGRV